MEIETLAKILIRVALNFVKLTELALKESERQKKANSNLSRAEAPPD